MHADGYRFFLEVGPRGIATAAIHDILRGKPHTAQATDSIHRTGILQFQHALALLAASVNSISAP